MQISNNDYDKMLAWIDDPSTPVCGDDGWIPTLRELKEQIFPAYDAACSIHTAKSVDDAKKILLFLLWISESSDALDEETNKEIRSFLGEHLELDKS